ncbi:NeuD/PglB/VioB family sugar acetyltransferase [Caulobacter hibisci]|uniref:NeuD/PglB/VioB family sugar acetyltransferase n=1 Tax=Caulobacter hibisci TaxID=2035993 RepID=A0ABS0SZT6_9CAUL|nr:NeuD/PglB/VioB family sugar acetyltransferase [Caulobacter hibisci]MBI1684966.1 NeuD/PglB/VioB family sugar acetyltransferase [Caulobacter hibisci]
MDYVMVGGGALAREIIDWFGPQFARTGDRFVGYLDDGDAPMARFGRDLPQLGPIAGYTPAVGVQLVMGIGTPAGKAAVAQALRAAGGTFATLVHDLAFVTASARLGEGVLVGPFVNVSSDSKVGDLVTVNGHSGVGHDVELGDYSTLSCHVDLTGRVKVGEGVFFGSGARVLPGVSIGAKGVIGAGAVIVRDTAPGATYFAAPARKL